MPDDSSRQEWVTRVLGYQFAGATAPAGRATPIWQAAKDAVDDQLRTLSDQLRKTGVPALAMVSHDVEHLLDHVRVDLVASLLDYDRAPAQPDTLAAALSAIAAASDWLGGDQRVQAVDTNPFGVTVNAGATLGAALRQLQRDLAGTAGAAA